MHVSPAPDGSRTSGADHRPNGQSGARPSFRAQTRPDNDQAGIGYLNANAFRPDMTAPDMTNDEIALAQAQRILQFISSAREFFPAMRDLADHPGWEIMLHLFISGHQGRIVSTVDLCEMTGTWRPLAMRYIEMLFERGLIDRDVTAGKPESWALSLAPATQVRLGELLCSYATAMSAQEASAASN